eukprot:5251088-Lingulodinium_polyedra.AAC.1
MEEFTEVAQQFVPPSATAGSLEEALSHRVQSSDVAGAMEGGWKLAPRTTAWGTARAQPRPMRP